MDKKMPKFVKRLLVIIPCAIVLLIVAVGCFDVVPAGYKGVKVTMGAVDDVVLNEGLAFKLPFAQSIVHVDARVKKYTVEGETSASKDMQTITTNVARNYGADRGINIIDLTFSEAFDRAIEEKQVAEQNALKAEADLKRIKTEAEQAVVKAQGEAEAMRIKNEALTDSIIELEFLNKWDGHMPTYYGGDADLLLSLNPDKNEG